MVNMPLSYYIIIIIIIIIIIHLESPITKKTKKAKRFLGIENYNPNTACVETKEVKVLWNILLHLDVVPKDGGNKPDIAICDKKESQWLIFEGTVCNIGQIQERDKLKTEKYTDIRASLK